MHKRQEGAVIFHGWGSAPATATASAIVALQNFTAKGTFTIFSRTITNVQQDGRNEIYSITQRWSYHLTSKDASDG